MRLYHRAPVATSRVLLQDNQSLSHYQLVGSSDSNLPEVRVLFVYPSKEDGAGSIIRSLPLSTPSFPQGYSMTEIGQIQKSQFDSRMLHAPAYMKKALQSCIVPAPGPNAADYYFRPNTIATNFLFGAAKFPERKFLGTRSYQKDGTRGAYEWINFEKARQRAEQLSVALRSKGIAAGESVGIMSVNRTEWL